MTAPAGGTRDGCGAPIDAVVLLDYWLGALAGPDEAARRNASPRV